MGNTLLQLLLTMHLLLPLVLTFLSLLLGLPLLALASEGSSLGRAAGWRPPLGLLEAFGRWLGLLQLLPLLLSLLLLSLRGFGEGWPLGGLRLGSTGEAFGLALSFSDLGFFFALMAQLVLVLTDLNFRCSPLEERSREVAEEGFGAEESRRRHRARRQLVFGLCLGLLQLLLLLFFYTDNLLVFFGAFEASVLPIFLLMGYFGKRSQKFRAMAYLLFFTLLSALPLLLLLLELYQRSATVDYGQLLFLQRSGLLLTEAELPWAFMAFFLPFGVKMAAFPLHGWLPEAHVEASTEGSMLLSGVLLKVGLYGLLRCCLELCGGATLGLAPYLLTAALVGALVTSLSAYRQLDLKKIIAYSSVVHMNLSLVGCFCLSSTALSATLFLNFGHAVVSAGLFAAVGVLQDRCRTRQLLELSGLDRAMPLWSGALLLLLLANAGMPGTVGFLGEAGLLWGCFQHFLSVGFLALPAVGLMGLRNLLLYAQLCWGVAPAFLNPLRLPSGPVSGGSSPLLLRHWDVAPLRDGLVLLLLAGLSLLLGFWPQPLLGLLEETSLLLPEAAALLPLTTLGAGVPSGPRRGLSSGKPPASDDEEEGEAAASDDQKGEYFYQPEGGPDRFVFLARLEEELPDHRVRPEEEVRAFLDKAVQRRHEQSWEELRQWAKTTGATPEEVESRRQELTQTNVVMILWLAGQLQRYFRRRREQAAKSPPSPTHPYDENHPNYACYTAWEAKESEATPELRRARWDFLGQLHEELPNHWVRPEEDVRTHVESQVQERIRKKSDELFHWKKTVEVTPENFQLLHRTLLKTHLELLEEMEQLLQHYFYQRRKAD